MKKFLAVLLCLVMTVAAFSGCTSTNDPADQTAAPADQTAAPADQTAAPADQTPAPDAEPVSSQDTLVIVTNGDPGRLRSDTINNLANMTYNRLIYDYLFTRNSKGARPDRA